MRVVVQRVNQAEVSVEGEVIGKIGPGLALLVGVGQDDGQEDVDYLARKISNLRIFEDQEGKMNLSVKDVGGDILSVSQFTLHANTKKGNRPSFAQAGDPELALDLYQKFNQALEAAGLKVETGKFAAHMHLSLSNNGPVTILIDSKEK